MPHMDEGRLQAWIDGDRSGMSAAEREEVEAHLASCAECRGRLEELRAFGEAAGPLLGAVAGDVEAVPDFSEVVARAGEVEREGGAAGAEPEADGFAGSERDATAPTLHTAKPRPRRLPLRWAASIVVAIGVGWMANEMTREDPSPRMQDGSAAASAPASDPASVPAEATAMDPTADLLGDRADESPGDGSQGNDSPSSAPPVATLADVADEVATATEPDRRRDAEPVSPAREAERRGGTALRFQEAESALTQAVEVELERPVGPIDVLRGRVVDATSGRTLESAQVFIPGTAIGGLTNRAGEFVVDLRGTGDSTDAVELRVELIGYTAATERVSLTEGSEVFGDIALESSALRLQELVVTGVAADDREGGAVAADLAGTPVIPSARLGDPTVAWRTAEIDEASRSAGFRLLLLPGVEIVGVEVGEIDGSVIVRVYQRLDDTTPVVIFQSRARLLPGDESVGTEAMRVTSSGIHLLGRAPIERENLVALLDQAR